MRPARIRLAHPVLLLIAAALAGAWFLPGAGWSIPERVILILFGVGCILGAFLLPTVPKVDREKEIRWRRQLLEELTSELSDLEK